MKKLLIAFILSLSACSPSVHQLQQQAWLSPWEMCPDDWEAKPSCSCRNRALWIEQQAAIHNLGPVEFLIGYRDEAPDELHMVPVLVSHNVVIDYDGVWSLSSYLDQWTEQPYDLRSAIHKWQHNL